MKREDLLKLVADLANYLRYQELLGLREAPISRPMVEDREKAADFPVFSGTERGARPVKPSGGGRKGEVLMRKGPLRPRSSELEMDSKPSVKSRIGYPLNPALVPVREAALACRRCPLHSGRKTVVFGTGNENAGLMFVGEAPGADEDARGEPFVGRAGKLLTRLIEEIGLTREEVYIANIIKCRPPDNRNPRPEEISSCEPYLVQQLEIIQPQLICALGTFATQTLLKTREPISRLRGRFHLYHNTRVLPTYHPAFVLRYPDQITVLREDLLRLKEEYLKGKGETP